jgi:RNA polymerase-interacting CarD/CdnL/TRCF family regulator
MSDFIANLRWLAEQRRLQDLERRYRQAERIALRELLLALSNDDAEIDDDLEVSDDGENEASATDQ